MYIPENTMVQNEQKKDVVTRVIFKAVLKREQFGEKSTEVNPELPLKPIEGFFVFKGGNTDIENYKYNNYNKDNTTFFILRPEDVEIYASASTTEHIHIYLREGILEAIRQFKEDHPDFNFSNWRNEKPAESANLSFYKNGEMYYEVPIEHFSVAEAQGIGKYGRFGVVRNNWYKLNIEKMISYRIACSAGVQTRVYRDCYPVCCTGGKKQLEYSDQKSVNHILNKHKGYDKYFKKDNLY